jgi:hypothetical protein
MQCYAQVRTWILERTHVGTRTRICIHIYRASALDGRLRTAAVRRISHHNQANRKRSASVFSTLQRLEFSTLQRLESIVSPCGAKGGQMSVKERVSVP